MSPRASLGYGAEKEKKRREMDWAVAQLVVLT